MTDLKVQTPSFYINFLKTSVVFDNIFYIIDINISIINIFLFLFIAFKNQRNLANVLRFKDRLPYHLVACVVHKFHCEKCHASFYSETDRHWKVTSGEEIGISQLTVKKVKPSAESSVRDHLLFLIMDPHLMIFPFRGRRLISFY